MGLEGCKSAQSHEAQRDGPCQILMRQNQTHVIRPNHQIPYLSALKVFWGSNRSFIWTAFDFCGEDEVPELFAVQFGLPAIADAFKAANKAILDP
jgi:hypothetical protein